MRKPCLLLFFSFFFNAICCQVPAGNVLWLRADRGVYTDIAGTPASYGDLVAVWEDQSGNGNDFRQELQSQRPQLAIPGSAICARPSLRFDVGRSTYLCSPMKLSGAVSIFIVFVSPAIFGNPETLLSLKGISNSYTEILCTDNPAYQPLSYMADMPGSISGGTTSSSVGSNVSFSPAGNLFTMVYNGGNSSSPASYLTNYDAVSSAVNSSGLFGRLLNDSTTIGGRAPQQNYSFLSGDIAEIIVYNRVLSAAEITQAENYLVTKYGLNESCTPLALKLHNFYAMVNGEEVHLKWNVSDDTDIKQYIIEHKTTGNEWQSIATEVPSQVTGADKEYKYVHVTPVKGLNYYRIKFVASDQGRTYSAVKIVDVFPKREYLTTYPNPFHEYLYIRTAEKELLHLVITNSSGVIEKNISVFSNAPIDLRSLSTGIHFVRVSGSKYSVTKIIMKKPG